MSSTITVRELLYRVSTSLLDLQPQFQRWKEAELVGWINEAQLSIAKYLPPTCSRVDAIKLVAGTRQYIGSLPSSRVITGDGATIANISGNAVMHIGRNMGANGSTPGRAIRIVDRDALDYLEPEWHSAAATTPVRQYTFDPRTPKYFYVSPPVPASGWWVEVAYLADPPAIPNPGTGVYAWEGGSNTTQTLTIDDKNADDVYNYVMARAQLKDAEASGNSAMAQQFVQLFVNSINAQAAALTGVNPNLQSLPLNPTIPAAAR